MTVESTRNPENQPVAQKPARKLWSTALLLAASAAFGGLAVAIWDRKTLADMRNRMPESPRRSVGREDDIY
jgi:fatty acid desaturase